MKFRLISLPEIKKKYSYYKVDLIYEQLLYRISLKICNKSELTVIKYKARVIMSKTLTRH